MQKTICKIDECENNIVAWDWCDKHYRRWKKYDDPNFTKHHGYSHHSLYWVWGDMKKRCYNSKHKMYKYYGGRGISICDEWIKSFTIFKMWCFENGWKKGLEIDRRDNDGDYTPENCRFVTHKENMHNQKLLRKNNTSGYRGIDYQDKKWRARIYTNGKRKSLGSFNSPRLAALQYDVEAYLTDNRPRNLF